MRSFAVIGKNFGDEGKGLVTASLCLSCKKPLIIKHNGGAQAGHTVENSVNKTRFIHHQTGSGSEYGAATLFADSYCPDLYQLGNELTEFEQTFHFIPKIYSEPDVKITILDDVLINMAIETERGQNRHGSCGMGIWECSLRNKTMTSGYSITIKEVMEKGPEELISKLKTIREHYTKKRIASLELSAGNQYIQMLEDENMLCNFAETIRENVRYIEITDAGTQFLNNFDYVIFETGQGLLLDEANRRFMPHVTASKTGVANPVSFLDKRGLTLDEAIYVTRPYVTRHGAGPLPCECNIEELPGVKTDNTNVTNEWQGSIRYARHESISAFLEPVFADSPVSQSAKGNSILQTGNYASILQTGNYASILQTGNNASILQTGNYASILQAGNYASILQTGNNASILQAENNASILQTGNNASILQAGNMYCRNISGAASHKISLALTHLDETDNKIYFSEQLLNTAELINQINKYFFNIYGSYDHEKIIKIN